MDIGTLIESSELTWRDILYEVIKGLDPWDIDIAELASRYSERITQMQEANFRIPANVVLVSSVLLRMKADILNPHDPEPYTELSESFQYFFGEEVPEFPTNEEYSESEPALALKPARMPTRRVTAVELIDAIQKALSERSSKHARILGRTQHIEDNSVVIFDEADMRTLTEETYRQVMSILGDRSAVLFSELARTRGEVISVFLSLLHLWNDGMLNLSQKKLFGEIYIQPLRMPD